jgi:membrane fusion protein, multidrug efflux system
MFIAVGSRLAPAAIALVLASAASAEVATDGAPAVSVLTAEYRTMTDSTEINGRIQSRQRVDLGARVTAFLTERLFEEGAEVKNGQLLYRLERAPFEADVEAKQAAIAEAEAQLENANIALARAQELFQKSVGTQVALDDALATQRTAAAQ